MLLKRSRLSCNRINIRLENEPKNLLWFDNVPTTTEGASAITKIAEKLRDPEVVASEDQDYVWHDGSIHLPRMRQMKGGKEQFGGEQGVPIRTVQNMWQGDGALEMTIDAAGSPDSLYFRRTDTRYSFGGPRSGQGSTYHGKTPGSYRPRIGHQTVT